MQITNVSFVKSVAEIKDLPGDGKPHIAFVGRSNAGKSSLINSLVKSDICRVSATPGRTRLVNLFDVDGRWILADLPGYGYAKASKKSREQFASLIYDYLASSTDIRLVVVVTDARTGLTDLDQEMLELLRSGKFPLVVVANKIDKLSKTEARGAEERLAAQVREPVVAASSLTGAGRGELLAHVSRALQPSSSDAKY